MLRHQYAGINKSLRISWVALLMVGIGSIVSPAATSAASLTWYGDGTNPGGGGTWDTLSPDWYNGSFNPWNNADSPPDDAVLGTTGGAVTVGAAITVENLSFNVTGYSLSNANSLTLAGTTPTITVSTGTATINTLIQGSVGLIKAGSGTLTLTNNNTYGGGTSVTGGTLILDDTGKVGTTTILAANSNLTITGATVSLRGNTSNTIQDTTAGTVTINSGGVLSADNTSNNAHNLYNVALNGGTLSYTQAPTTLYGHYVLNGGVTTTGDSNVITAVLAFVANHTFTVGTGTQLTQLTVSGAMQDLSGAPGYMIKTGGGTMTMTANNTYSNGTTVSGGTLILDNTSTSTAYILAANSNLTITGATVSLRGNKANAIYDAVGGTVTINSGGVLSADSTSNNAHNLNTVLLNGGTLANTTAPLSGNGNYLLNNTVTTTGDSNLISARVNLTNATHTFTVGTGTQFNATDRLRRHSRVRRQQRDHQSRRRHHDHDRQQHLHRPYHRQRRDPHSGQHQHRHRLYSGVQLQPHDHRRDREPTGQSGQRDLRRDGRHRHDQLGRRPLGRQHVQQRPQPQHCPSQRRDIGEHHRPAVRKRQLSAQQYGYHHGGLQSDFRAGQSD